MTLAILWLLWAFLTAGCVYAPLGRWQWKQLKNAELWLSARLETLRILNPFRRNK